MSFHSFMEKTLVTERRGSGTTKWSTLLWQPVRTGSCVLAHLLDHTSLSACNYKMDVAKSTAQDCLGA